MAVLRQLAAFAGELYQAGAVDEGERQAVLEELGKRERRLEITGVLAGRGEGARNRAPLLAVGVPSRQRPHLSRSPPSHPLPPPCRTRVEAASAGRRAALAALPALPAPPPPGAAAGAGQAAGCARCWGEPRLLASWPWGSCSTEPGVCHDLDPHPRSTHTRVHPRLPPPAAELKRGDVFWQADSQDSAAARQRLGLFIVLSGAVRRRWERPQGSGAKVCAGARWALGRRAHAPLSLPSPLPILFPPSIHPVHHPQEYYQSTGGVVGALLAGAGTALPGSDVAVAEGNSLGRGPLVYHLPQSAVDALLREGGSGGAPAAAQSRLELLRLAGSHVLECGEADVRAAAQAHLVLQRRGKAPAQPGAAARAGSTPSRPQGALPAASAHPAGSTMQLAALVQVRPGTCAGPQLCMPCRLLLSPEPCLSICRPCLQLLGAVEVEEQELSAGAGPAAAVRDAGSSLAGAAAAPQSGLAAANEAVVRALSAQGESAGR